MVELFFTSMVLDKVLICYDPKVMQLTLVLELQSVKLHATPGRIALSVLAEVNKLLHTPSLTQKEL